MNTEEFFLISDWVFISKTEISSAGKSGAFDLGTDLWKLYEDVMLVFKSGRYHFSRLPDGWHNY